MAPPEGIEPPTRGLEGRRSVPLSYGGNLKSGMKVVFPAGFEPTAPRLGIWCSIQLSYGNNISDHLISVLVSSKGVHEDRDFRS